MHCVPESAGAYRVAQETKDNLFQTNKQEISQIKSRIADEADLQQHKPKNDKKEKSPIIHRENKNNNEMELSEKFSYEPIYCTVNEAPMTAKEKERQEKKIKKNMKNTLAFYSEEF